MKIKNNIIYNFDRKKIFRVKYITKNSRSSQGHKQSDKISMNYKNILLAKNKLDLF